MSRALEGDLGASDLDASDLGASDLGASGLAVSDLAASDFAAAGLGASDLEGSCFGGGGGGGSGAGGVAAGCPSAGSGGVVAGWDCTDDGGVAADCVCSTGGWGSCCGGAGGCCCAAANSEPPNAADINSFPKSCCRLTNQSSMRKPEASHPCRHKQNHPVAVQRQIGLAENLATSGPLPVRRAAPIVAALHLDRVRKRCRTISYTISVVTVFPERVKRSVPGADGRHAMVRQATYGSWCPETGRRAQIIKKKLDG